MSSVDLSSLRRRVEQRLDVLVPGANEPPEKVHCAMRYCLLAPAKRVRPLLTILTARHLGSESAAVVDIGCAIEMVHTASLILDDLPSMDDATLRRGRPAAHRSYGESTAILAAVALLNRSFGVISALEHVDVTVRVKLIDVLSRSIGSTGLIGGQHSDLTSRARFIASDQVEMLNHQKTGVLFVAAVEAGARVAGADEAALVRLREFARRLGLAFQTLDDVIDASASMEDAQKDVRRDAGRPNLVSLIGEEGARSSAVRHLEAAHQALGAGANGYANGSSPLREFVELAFARAHAVTS